MSYSFDRSRAQIQRTQRGTERPSGKPTLKRGKADVPTLTRLRFNDAICTPTWTAEDEAAA